MAPPGLNHPDFRIRKEMNRLLQEIRLGDEIRVQDTNKVAFRGRKPAFQRASLKPGAIRPVDELNVEPAGPQFIDTAGRQRLRIVR